MVDGLMSASDHPLNGYFLYDHHALAERYHLACNTDRKIMLIGVGFALMDLAARQSIVMRKQDVVMETVALNWFARHCMINCVRD
jgi:hypothetical protein